MAEIRQEIGENGKKYTKQKVQALIRDGLKLSNVNITSVLITFC